MLTTQRQIPTATRSTGSSGPAEGSWTTLVWAAVLMLGWLLVLCGAVRGGTIYVDSRQGNDRYDGRHATVTGFDSGPVRTLAAALRLVDSGDSIELANNGTPYYGSLTLYGARHSGTFNRPFEIRGNGATLSGAKPVGLGCWRRATDDLWRVTPIGKTYFQLVSNGKAVPEVASDRSTAAMPMVAEGEWCAWRGAVYYHAQTGVDPDRLGLSLSDANVGITLVDVENVVIRDLTLQHFRIDGINAHDRCRRIELVNITLEENGRTGLAVGGTSRVVVKGSKIARNREASVLITELGEARLEATETDVAPTVVE